MRKFRYTSSVARLNGRKGIDSRRAVAACLIASLTGACGIHSLPYAPPVPEILPVTSPIADEPEAQSYVAEFAVNIPEPAAVAVADRPQPELPIDRHRVKGWIFEAMHDDASSLWTILSYDGANWMEDQYCYLLFEKSDELREVPTICSKGTIGELMLIPPQEEMPARLLCSFTDKHGNWNSMSSGHAICAAAIGG